MTEGGAKSRRASGIDDAPTPSAFAPLRPFLKSNETDLSRGLENLSAELARLDSQVRLDVEVLEGSDTHAWVLECGRGRPLVRPRPRAEKKKPNVRVVVRHEVWLQIAQGKLSPFEAFITGRLLVGGDTEIAKRIVQHLSDPSVPYVSPC
jgi:SCP-2 sterol transfer family